jgi:endonuclease/exonuclease/phosphatase (EEP) superfamily protein YafD
MRLLRAVVTGLVLLVGLATLLGLLDRVSWVFELADVFRLQYLALLVGAALAALALRRPRLALVAAALALVNVAVLGIPLTPTATASNEHIRRSLRLVVANIEVGNTDFAAVGRLVAKTHPDVFGVTELTPAMVAGTLILVWPEITERALLYAAGAASIVLAAAEAASLSSVKDARQRWLGAAVSVVAYVFGIALLASPGNSLHAVIVVLGIYLVVLGWLRVLHAAEAWRQNRSAWS